MKIVGRNTFLTLPEETLYSKYAPCIFGPLEIKGATVGTNDFCSQQIADAVRCKDSVEFSDVLDVAQENGTSLVMDFDCQGRDGFFDDEQLFAVWEDADVAMLIERLSVILGSNRQKT